jgi:hypothetical protein
VAKKRGFIKRFAEPFNLFYLGFLASVGLAFGSAMIINLLRTLIEIYFNTDILIYSRIAFVIFYLSFIRYSYYLLEMKKNKSLRNGFILFSIIYIISTFYLWFFNILF